jgi:hypothetical protein
MVCYGLKFFNIFIVMVFMVFNLLLFFINIYSNMLESELSRCLIILFFKNVGLIKNVGLEVKFRIRIMFLI